METIKKQKSKKNSITLHMRTTHPHILPKAENYSRNPHYFPRALGETQFGYLKDLPVILRRHLVQKTTKVWAFTSLYISGQKLGIVYVARS